jgi:glutamate-1-semialdehyde 2,1-aminomutase
MLADQAEQAPPARTLSQSRAAALRAQSVLPGGLVRSTLKYPPHPVFADHGEGAWLFDIDGNRYLDLHNNFTALAVGHAHPNVVAAVSRQLTRGTTFGAPTTLEGDLAELIVSRVASIEQVTFTNSGTEAAAAAVALARAFTGHDLIAKFEGGYHGWDGLYVSVRPTGDADHGAADRPRNVRNSAGTPQPVADLLLTLPFNNAEAARAILEPRARELAAIILEPYQSVGGGICPDPAFLTAMQALARELDILFILDEIVTLRLAVGGAQQLFGLQPDLTLLGKIIGGGLPVGGVGGRRDILDLLNGAVHQSGTFSGNPLTMAAGCATLNELSAPAIERLNRLGDAARAELEASCRRQKLPIVITGLGSLINFHFTDAQAIRASRDTWADHRGRALAFFKGMLDRGYHLTLRGGVSLSTPMTEVELEGFVSAATEEARRACAAA